jgi:hypothetical protein
MKLKVMVRATGLLLCAVLAWSEPARAEEDISSFIDRIVAAHGGAQALPQGTIVRQTGRTVSKMRGGAAGAFVRVFQGANKLRVDITFPGAEPETRVLDGRHGWRQGVESPAPMRAAMQLQAARLALPLLLLEKKDQVMDRGTATGHNGERLRALELPLSPHLVLFVWADQDSGRILASRGIIDLGGAKTMEFATIYGDFQTWEGRLFAGREEQFAMGRNIGYTLIETVEFLDTVAPGTFRP